VIMTNTKKHTGSCHCGAVKLAVEIDATTGSRCNCSICTKLGIIGAIAKPDDLVVSGEASCATYRWGGMTATRYFCATCGITTHLRGHLPELGGDYVSINLNALDDVDPHTIELVYWDGRHNNWDAGPSKTPWPIRATPSTAAAV
jgi:hypothetical protein